MPHDHTVEHGGFRTVLWEAPKDLRAAVEDVVVFLNYLQKCHRDLSQGATAQLLVLCNRTAVHNQLLQHGFQAAWFGGLRIATTSSAAGATARIAVIIQTGCGFLSGGRRGASLEDREDCYGRATVADKSNPTHLHCLSHRHGRNYWHGSNVGGLPLWILYIEKQTSPVPCACTGTLGWRSCLRVGTGHALHVAG